jgi:hypothetical protein
MKPTTNLLRQTIVNRSKTAAIIMALLLTVGISSSFASDTSDIIKEQVTTSFRKGFRNAQIVSYENHVNYNKVTFRMNDIVLFAYYSDKGELLAVVRNILSSQLPVQLMVDLKNNYNGFWISELFEINGEGQNTYYVTLENADHKITLRSTDATSWEVYEKKDKE